MSSRFSTLRPGPKLAKRLAAVELGSLSDEAVLDYLHAEVKQLAVAAGAGVGGHGRGAPPGDRRARP